MKKEKNSVSAHGKKSYSKVVTVMKEFNFFLNSYSRALKSVSQSGR